MTLSQSRLLLEPSTVIRCQRAVAGVEVVITHVVYPTEQEDVMAGLVKKSLNSPEATLGPTAVKRHTWATAGPGK